VRGLPVSDTDDVDDEGAVTADLSSDATLLVLAGTASPLRAAVNLASSSEGACAADAAVPLMADQMNGCSRDTLYADLSVQQETVC